MMLSFSLQFLPLYRECLTCNHRLLSYAPYSECILTVTPFGCMPASVVNKSVASKVCVHDQYISVYSHHYNCLYP